MKRIALSIRPMTRVDRSLVLLRVSTQAENILHESVYLKF